MSTSPPSAAAVERIRPVLERHALHGERAGTLHPEVVRALRDADLFAIAAPRAVGGLELPLAAQLEVYERAAYGDGSAGWCLMIGALVTAMMGAYLPDRAVETVFGSARLPIAAGLQQPAGVARRVRDGFVVDGRWGFGSGVVHADWIFTAAVVANEPTTAGGASPMIAIAVPVARAVIEPTWDAMGLRATGSHHYRLDAVDVPAAMTCPFPNAPALRGGPVFRLPFIAYVAVGHLAFALGVAARALDEVAASARSKLRTWSRRPLAEDGAFAVDFGRARAKLAAARALSREILRMLEERAEAGASLTPVDFGDVTSAVAHVTEVSANVSAFALRAAGAAALDASAIVQRCFRDAHAALQHVVANDDGFAFAASAMTGAPRLHLLAAPRPDVSTCS